MNNRITNEKKLGGIEVLLQMVITLIINAILYYFLALTDHQGGVDGILGMILIHTIYACFVSVLFTAFCFIIGLPIRLISKIRRFCQKYCLVFVLTFILGLILYIFSFTNYFSSIVQVNEDGHLISVFQPNLKLLLIGWFLMSFSTLHFNYFSFLKDKFKFSAKG